VPRPAPDNSREPATQSSALCVEVLILVLRTTEHLHESIAHQKSRLGVQFFSTA
jgi:hypothetical protein